MSSSGRVAPEIHATRLSPPVSHLAVHAGKYSRDRLPKGPRAVLFRQLLPGIQPLTEVLGAIAEERGKTTSQVAINW